MKINWRIWILKFYRIIFAVFDVYNIFEKKQASKSTFILKIHLKNEVQLYSM